MDKIIESITEWLKEFFIGAIQTNLSTMFNDVNTKVGTIAGEVGQTPQGWNASIFNMIKNLSDNVILPIAGIIITYVLCYELIHMVMEKNHGNDMEFWEFFVYFVKMWIAVWILSHTFDITMAVFDIGQHIVSSASGVISSSSAIDASSVIAQMTASMDSMELSELLLLMVETWIVGFGMKILSVLITVILYGRMIEIYLYCSVAPIPFATVCNREWGTIGTNYFKGLFALAFQGFFIMVCVGIYAVLINSMTISSDVHMALFSIMAYTIVLCFSLFHTGTLSKSVFNAH
ncbi:MAG: hypothetical protein ILP17_09020 [Lachnospiraceae bacterium]|nr:hypothetical protein [Lachnospiraceae bacterium]